MKRASSESTRERWAKIIRQQLGSGVPVAAFCQREGVAVSTFFFWKRRLAEEETAQSPSFVEVIASPGSESSGDVPLELVLGGDRRLLVRRGFDAEALREVVRALEGLS